MTRCYNHEVDLRVLTDSIEKSRLVHPPVLEFDLYEEEYENCDVWRNGWVGQLKGRGSEKSDRIPTKDERNDHLSKSGGYLNVGSTHLKQNKWNHGHHWHCNPPISSKTQARITELRDLRGSTAARMDV